MSIRIDHLREAMREDGLDCVLISSYANIRYFSGFTSDESKLLVTKDRCCLFTDFRYTIQAAEQAPEFEIIEPETTPYAAIGAVMASEGCKKCGFEDGSLSVAEYKSYQELPVEYVAWGTKLTRLRIVKSQDEVICLQKAQDIADASFAELLKQIRPGMTEREVAARLTYIGSLMGSEGPSFDPIVAAGANGAMCHAIPGDRKLAAGDLVVMDFGCMYKGYHSDMTRTIAIGSITEECRKIYDIVLEAQLKSLEALKPGIGGRELHNVAAGVIASYGYGDCFGHGLGHGFGYEIHESPRAAKRSEDLLLPGMTITIEPGIYVEGLCGVRIEDCVVMTETGFINFCHTTKELITIQ